MSNALSQGMSDDMMDVCMRSYHLAMVRESYLGGIKREVEARNAVWDDITEIFEYDCPYEDCPCTSNDIKTTHDKIQFCKSIHFVSESDETICLCDKTHLYSAADDEEDNSSDTLQDDDSYQDYHPAVPRSPSPTIPSYNWPLVDLTADDDDETLEHNLQSFDFLLSRLLPHDSPHYPPRILNHLAPGCPQCLPLQSHPLPRYAQYAHDLHDLNVLLYAQGDKWIGFSDEVVGHRDWEFAFETFRGLGRVQGKVEGMGLRMRWFEGGDLGSEGLGELLREAVEGGREELGFEGTGKWGGGV
ncbi:MAG: hypothetical protein LQ339_009015 [Xanthoria mediterranea]|nr:MAG: hypothetical protein LQ339_009015 [Xanthoria mediterranea]